MSEQSWKYVKPLQDDNSVGEFELAHGFRFPDDLKAVILKNNGGRPPLKRYDLRGEKGKEFKTLLSFNHTDVETIYKAYPLDSTDKSLVPFASDPSGNYFVIHCGKVALWDHERDKVILIADTFSEFLSMLY